MASHTVLGFEVLCDFYAPWACQHEVFKYFLRKTTQEACYFTPQSGVEKIIINMVNSDHHMQDTVVRVTGPWDAELEDECGAVPIA